MKKDYYTYAYLREDRTPYYIGKGRGWRIYCTHRVIKVPKNKSLIIFLKKNLTEAEAFKHEIYMINVFGRKDLGTGILRNLTNGGEGSSGAIHSEETKKKISVASTGKTLTEETKKKMSESKTGVPRTEKTKKKISEAHINKTHTEETKKKISEALSGRFLGALNPGSKAIIAIKPDVTELHFGGRNQAARGLGINPGTLSGYLKTGYVPTKGKFKGWQFVYENP